MQAREGTRRSPRDASDLLDFERPLDLADLAQKPIRVDHVDA